MKKILYFLCILSWGCFLGSCDDTDNTVIPPTFKGFTYAPSTLHPGDTVTLSAVYASKGKYCYKPRTTWRITLDTLNAETKEYVRVTLSNQRTCSISEENLSVRFAIPHSARPSQTCPVKFDVAFDNAVDAENQGYSLPNPTQEGYVGQFDNSVVNSLLYSHCSGSLSVKLGD